MGKSVGVLLVVGLVAMRSARADTWTNTYGNSFNNPTSALMNKFMWDDINKRSLYESTLKKRGYTDEQLHNMTAYQMEQALLNKKGAPAPGDGARGSAAPPPQQPPQFVAGATVFQPAQDRLIVTPLLDQLVTDKVLRRKMGQAAYQAFQG